MQLDDKKNQAEGYFGLPGIGKYVAPLPSPLTASSLTHLYDGTQNQEAKIQNFFDRMRSDIIYKAIDGSITKKISINLGFIVGYMNGDIMGR